MGADFWSPLSVMGPSSLVDESPREGIYDNQAPSGGAVSGQVRGVQRKTFLVFGVFRGPRAQNIQCTNSAYLGVACPELLQSHCGGAFAPLRQMCRVSDASIWSPSMKVLRSGSQQSSISAGRILCCRWVSSLAVRLYNSLTNL